MAHAQTDLLTELMPSRPFIGILLMTFVATVSVGMVGLAALGLIG